jgi:hypothetical protein
MWPGVTPTLPHERTPGERKPSESPVVPECTTTFTGAEGDSWSAAPNWSSGIPAGPAAYGCIPAGYPQAVTFDGSAGTATEIGGVSAENPQGIALETGALILAGGETSTLSNVKPGGTTVSLDEGATLALTGTEGGLGGSRWNGPGTLEIPRGAELKTGDCAEWGYRGTRCASAGGGTPTPGHEGLQVRNFGTMYGSGITLCRDGAGRAATFENQGTIQIRESGSFGSASECGEVGAMVNGKSGRIAVAQLDGNGCNVVVGIPALVNEGLVSVSSCLYLETAELRRPRLEIGSSVTEAGTIRNWGIIEIQGDFTQNAASELYVGVRATSFGKYGALTTNFGTIKVAGNAKLAGTLNIEPDSLFTPTLGQTLEILSAEGSLSGELALGKHCIPTEPGNGYQLDYTTGIKGAVMLEVAKMADC